MQQTRTGITGFTLKLAAIIGMTANHVAHAFIAELPLFAAEALYWLGGITFPVMAYLIVEGYLHTSSPPRYLARLLIFALISQAPFTLLFGWTGNVFFTLAIGLILIWVHDTASSRLVNAGAIFAGMLVSLLCDWAVLGPLMIFMFFIFRTHRNGVLITMAVPFATIFIPAALRIAGAFAGAEGALSANAAGALGLLVSFEQMADAVRMMGLPMDFANEMVVQVCSIGYALIGFTVATILILGYNGQRGPSMKWFFYVYYPAHLLVIWAVKAFIVGN